MIGVLFICVDVLRWGIFEGVKVFGLDYVIGSFMFGKLVDMVMLRIDILIMVGWDKSNFVFLILQV